MIGVTRALLSVAAISLLVTSALAQSAEVPDGTQDSPTGVEEIIVTADRTPRPAGELPMSVVALPGDLLERSGISSIADLPNRVPGLVFTSNTVLGQPYIRGLGSDLISAGADNTVATFVDGVYRSRPAAVTSELFDVQRVEVLRGPQGTLFGRNATGGAIAVVSRRPQPWTEGNVDVSYGNFDAVQIRGAFNSPVAGERVLARISGTYRQDDGYTRNIFLREDTGDTDLWALRGQLRLLPTRDLDILLSGDFARDRSTRLATSHLVEPLEGNLGVALGGTVPDDARQITADLGTTADVIQTGGHIDLQWTPGPMTLRSITAYRYSEFDVALDLDFTEVPAATNRPDEQSRAFTQEVQLGSGTRDDWEWLAGLFYLHENAAQSLDVSVPIAGLRDRPRGDFGTDAAAAFGQVAYRPGESWKLTAGLRYSYERRSLDFVETINDDVVAAFDESENWDAFTPRFALEYTPTKHLLLYGTASRGFKSGGFNGTVAQSEPFDPEFVWAYELGAKSSFFDEQVRVAIAGFYYDYEDIQLQVLAPDALIPFPLVDNAGEATVFGLELEVAARPLPGLDTTVAVTLLDTRFEELEAIDPNDLAGDPDQSGNPLPRAPEVMVHVGADYNHALSDWGSLIWSLHYRYQSAMFFTVFADDTVRQKAYGLLDARLAFESPERSWFAAVFGRNLTDEAYATNGLRVDGQTGNFRTLGVPRTYGLEVGYRF